MSRSLFYFFLGWHFLCILVYNVHSTARGYGQLEEVPGSGYFQHAERIANTVASLMPLRVFARCTGTATGYGFFAPQVGSSFVLEVSLLDGHGSVLATTRTPPLKQAHSHLRYHSLLNRMQHLLEGDMGDGAAVSLTLRQARALAHCLAQRIARHEWGIPMSGRIRCVVHSYAYRQRASVYQKEIDPLPTL